jgi:hypothetical protein
VYWVYVKPQLEKRWIPNKLCWFTKSPYTSVFICWLIWMFRNLFDYCKCGNNIRYYMYFGKTDWQFLNQVNTHLPCNPATLFLHIYSKEMKAYVHKTCKMNTYSRFTWKSSTVEITQRFSQKWVDKQSYVHTIKYYSLGKKEWILVYVRINQKTIVCMHDSIYIQS